MYSTRRERGRTQRIFLIEAVCADDVLCFTVLGTTGNAYAVELAPDGEWRCSCPDATTRLAHCKHAYFVEDRVLRGCTYAEAVERIAARAFAHEIWAPAQQASEQSPAKPVDRRPWLGQECAICTEEMSADEPTHWCQRVCGNSLHESCWRMWCRARPQAVCPFCRA
jgi:hypothetical protein